MARKANADRTDPKSNKSLAIRNVLAKMPNVSILASIMHVSAAQNINIPPSAVADCANVKKANIKPPKIRLDLNRNG